ncbi:hypothetical protein RND71_010315 [Anisodus tanguticus]|uniref:Uncharacterized protein n=1 Tax=Anisodus tanguticus TaxID=243964 RepID=A0AAE1VSK7_9SOLA|nr:hypothetical protein RND71_010315 [Anisodus tanguticus]
MADSEFSHTYRNNAKHRKFRNAISKTASLIRTGAVKEGSVWAKGINALKKLREWSEIVAGPRWKTFIRRFNRNKSGRNAKFQYDPLSFSLNFDEGRRNNGEEEEALVLRNCSTRYASIPVSGKVSDGPRQRWAQFRLSAKVAL